MKKFIIKKNNKKVCDNFLETEGIDDILDDYFGNSGDEYKSEDKLAKTILDIVEAELSIALQEKLETQTNIVWMFVENPTEYLNYVLSILEEKDIIKFNKNAILRLMKKRIKEYNVL
jgi:hypothetical protein